MGDRDEEWSHQVLLAAIRRSVRGSRDCWSHMVTEITGEPLEGADVFALAQEKQPDVAEV